MHFIFCFRIYYLYTKCKLYLSVILFHNKNYNIKSWFLTIKHHIFQKQVTKKIMYIFDLYSNKIKTTNFMILLCT